MSTLHPRSSLATLVAAALLLAGCGRDTPVAPDESPQSAVMASAASIPVCHRSGTTGTIVQVSPAGLPGRLAQGDYLTTLVVTHEAGQPDDGAHFRHIGDALAAVRAGRLARDEGRTAACRITITVVAGNFRGTSGDVRGRDLEHFPLIVDVPDLTLRGATKMRLDARG